MSLFGAIQMAGNTLRANDIALQVVGQNIANANTPGYIREEVDLSPAPAVRVGGLAMGMGVNVDGIVQKVDKFLQERLRNAMSDDSSAATTQDVYAQLEGLVNALGDNGISNLMTKFANSISDVLNQPESLPVRNSAVLQGDTLTKAVAQLADNTQNLCTDLDKQVRGMATDINALVEQVRTLNVDIANVEGGGTLKSDAVGLRDQRSSALENLAKLINIKAVEQPSGAVTVYVNGDYLVAEGTSRKIEVVLDPGRGGNVSNLHVAGTDAVLKPSSGKLCGLLDARDNVLGGFLDGLDSFAQNLAFEFNKVYASGQGLTGFTKCTSQFGVDDKAKPLNDAGLPWTPKNGSFQILVRDTNTGLTQTTDISVDLNGTGQNMTLSDLKDEINQKVSGIKADITSTGQLTLESTSPQNQEFAFANDNSDLLASLGLNTFFSGSSAHDLAISADVAGDPGKFAASRGGIAADTDNAVDLANFMDRPITSQNGATIADLYDRLISDTTQASSVATATADGAHSFEETLQGQQLAVSGVNIDEEAVKMMMYQRSYQASAKYIATLSELLQVLVNL